MCFFKVILGILTFFMAFLFMPGARKDALAAGRLQPVDGVPVIVIDPGHGGENLGTQAGGIWDEKYMDMVTAQALYDELCLYDDVEVYLTRTGDTDVSFQERAAFAQSVNADFLFSIHYNASEYHELFGSEVWVPLAAPFNNYGYQAGYELLRGMQDRGLLIRGIKTREGERGDYYAIIRETVALGIPAAIIEHCHVDEDRDKDFCAGEEDLIRFGREDATAIAKYFGLKSSALQVDYSNYSLTETGSANPVASTLRDETPPDVCQIEFLSADYEAGILSLTLSAADYDSPLLYYTYSLDGGQTYSKRNAWPGSDVLTGKYEDTFTLNLTIPSGMKPSVIVRAYNMFDPYTESNRFDSPIAFSSGQNTPQSESGAGSLDGEGGNAEGESKEETSGAEASGPSPNAGAQDPGASGTDSKNPAAPSAAGPEAKPVSGGAIAGEKQVSFVAFLEICLVIVIFLFVILLVSQGIAYHNRKMRRRQGRREFQSRKEDGDSRNQPR